MSGYKQGDIVLASFQFTDKKGAKVRPALVLSNSLLDGNYYNDVLVMFITTTDHEDGFSMLIDNKRLSVSLPVKCYFRTFKLQSLSPNEIDKKISEVKPEYLKQIVEKVKSFIDVK